MGVGVMRLCLAIALALGLCGCGSKRDESLKNLVRRLEVEPLSDEVVKIPRGTWHRKVMFAMAPRYEVRKDVDPPKATVSWKSGFKLSGPFKLQHEAIGATVLEQVEQVGTYLAEFTLDDGAWTLRKVELEDHGIRSTAPREAEWTALLLKGAK